MCLHWTLEENQTRTWYANRIWNQDRKLRDVKTVFTHNVAQSFLNTQENGFGKCWGYHEQILWPGLEDEHIFSGLRERDDEVVTSEGHLSAGVQHYWREGSGSTWQHRHNSEWPTHEETHRYATPPPPPTTRVYSKPAHNLWWGKKKSKSNRQFQSHAESHLPQAPSHQRGRRCTTYSGNKSLTIWGKVDYARGSIPSLAWLRLDCACWVQCHCDFAEQVHLHT